MLAASAMRLPPPGPAGSGYAETARYDVDNIQRAAAEVVLRLQYGFRFNVAFYVTVITQCGRSEGSWNLVRN